ncbi:unnamed protein product [Rotaria sordida]|uniref:DUF2834 domain-containing protein n=1 Tax=Rotaria sordida TaxID=392033 RepID=A0A819SB24_9BILA|nr:unnamed protein product [Rotaria sordida]CAF4060342.1 unnamed protein product [Rotaria sordida]
MISNKIFWIIWFIFIIYSVLLAPKNDQTTKPTFLYVKQLTFGPWNDIDPYVITLFYYLGVWPFIYLSILLVDGQNQPFNGTLASSLSMALGSFILLPYFALRRSENARKFKLNFFVRLFDSKFISILLMLATVGLTFFAVNYGDFRVFLHEFWTNQFIHVMTIDFFIVSFLFPYLIGDDLERRKMTQNNQFQFYFYLCFIPLIGPLIYLYQRQPLQQIKQ